MEDIRFDTKIAVVLRDDLLPWQELNVTAFLVSGIAANPELLGSRTRTPTGSATCHCCASPSSS